jgi:small subunit ribosomal protein S2
LEETIMADISLQQLLEAGCHFGHKAERWNPKAKKFIYTEKDGIHIIDLVKTKDGLDAAVAYIKELVGNGGEILFVGTKRQAKMIVEEEAKRVGAPYMSERWIGGFLTNWDGIHANIKKILRMTEEQETGVWKKYPKHEQIKLGRYLMRLKSFYGGVLTLSIPPQAVFIIDVRKEVAAVREATRIGAPIVAMVDTNADPTDVQYPIPTNDDAIGAISLVMRTIADAYQVGKETAQRKAADAVAAKTEKKETKKAEPAKAEPVVAPEPEVITGQDVVLSTEPAPVDEPVAAAAPVEAKPEAAVAAAPKKRAVRTKKADTK